MVLQGTAESVSAGIAEYLKNTPPSLYVPPRKETSTRSPRRTIAIDAAQPLPALGLSPTLDNLHVRLGRCEHCESHPIPSHPGARARAPP